MIPARKSAGFARWFARDAERRLDAAFHSIRVRGLARVAKALAHGPVLVVTNHTAWWDPLVALFLGVRVLGADAYGMMDAKNLERLPFFGKVGAFGVNLGDPRDGARAIRYAAGLLAGSNRLVWVFPQGRERPVTARPLGFHAGSGAIARLAPAGIVIAGGLRYEMASTQRPSVWISFGAPLAPARSLADAHATQEAAVELELERIDRALVEGDDREFDMVRQRPEDASFALAERALAWITRP
jgi:1-acyl-sn-glycerol-3-phosphate acyltransferase